jgi:hypothetical protein
MVTAPHHGKGTVDALAGVDKNFLRNHFIAVHNEGDDSGRYKMASYTVDSDGKEVSFAKRCVEMLKDPERQFGAKSHSKSTKREEGRKVRARFYSVSNYRIDGKILPIENTAFKVVDGFDKPTYIDDEGKKKVTKKNGIQDHYHFYVGLDARHCGC